VSAIALAGCVLLVSRAAAGENAEPWRVLPFDMPEVAPLEADAAAEREVGREIEKLIASLAEIAKPDYGISSTLSGTDFPPVPGSRDVGCFWFTRHDLERADAVTRLVALGPRALPALIKHLGDATPTKLTITHDSGVGGMWYGNELGTNPALEDERKAVEQADLRPADAGEFPPHVDAHTVSVGDVCFVIIGMVSGRRYQAVRYQPTACIVINSPVKEPRLSDAVRRMWSGRDARRMLFERLMRDLHTRGQGSAGIQAGAAMRLLYYFPEMCAPVIVERLRGLDVKAPPDGSGRKVLERYDRNGVPESTLIKAVAWSREPRVVEALRAIARGSDDERIVASAAPAMVGAADAAFLGKLRRLLAKANPGYTYPSVGPGGLLEAVAVVYPDEAEEVFGEYLTAGGKESAINLLGFLRSNRADLAPSLLAPLLDDTSESGQRTESKAKFKGVTWKLPVRICDRAYVVISRALGDRTASISGTLAEMDERIAELKRRLADRPPPSDDRRR
jgi:hypothetical protein